MELWDEIMAAKHGGRGSEGGEAYAVFKGRLGQALGEDEPWLRAEREVEEMRARQARRGWDTGGGGEEKGEVQLPAMGVLTLTLFAW